MSTTPIKFTESDKLFLKELVSEVRAGELSQAGMEGFITDRITAGETQQSMNENLRKICDLLAKTIYAVIEPKTEEPKIKEQREIIMNGLSILASKEENAILRKNLKIISGPESEMILGSVASRILKRANELIKENEIKIGRDEQRNLENKKSGPLTFAPKKDEPKLVDAAPPRVAAKPIVNEGPESTTKKKR